MKRNRIARAALLTAAAAMACAGCALKPDVPEGEFLIRGRLTNVPDSTVIALYRDEGNLLKVMRQDTLLGGTFSFSDTLSATKKLLIMSDGEGFPGTWLDVWVAPGQCTEITGSDRLLKTWSVESDIPEQKEENGYAACTAEVNKELMRLSAEEATWLRELGKRNGDPGFDEKAVWAKIDSLRKLEEPLQQEVFKLELDYMNTVPVTPLWLTRLAQYASYLPYDGVMPYRAEIEELYGRLSEIARQTPEAKAVAAYLYPRPVVGVGDEMADGELYDTDGNPHRLAELKDEYILLDFWSSGCGPCVQSIPEMERLAERYRDRLAVVGISEDPKAHWKSFVREKGMKGHQWNELLSAPRTGLFARYQVRGIPHYVLIGPDRKIREVWSGYGPGSLEEKLKKHLNER